MPMGSPVDGQRAQKYDLGLFHQYDADKVKKRVVTEEETRGDYPRRSVYRSIDNVFGGGLLYGLTTLYGNAGTGKSKFCKEVAQAMAGNEDNPVVYVAAEATSDIPVHPNIIGLDFVENKPKYNKAADYVLGFCQDQQPCLLVIDSLTKLFSQTNKAVEEADVRSGCSRIEEACEGNIPALGTSEVRGSTNFEYPAGGQAVSHACAMLIRMRRHEVTSERDSREHGEPIGSTTWSMSIEKDRENKAKTGALWKPTYTRRGISFDKWEAEEQEDD